MSGRCFGVGVGPGDPELITIKAVKAISESSVVAYFSGPQKQSQSRKIADAYVTSLHSEMHFVYPITTGTLPPTQTYDDVISEFYDSTSNKIADVLDGTQDVAVLCEGDPFLHGSFMYLFNRLSPTYLVEVIPGIPSMLAATAGLGTPLVAQDESFVLLTSTMEDRVIVQMLEDADTAVILKVGRNFDRIRLLIDKVGLLDSAFYAERVGWTDSRLLPLSKVEDGEKPYFSMIVIPSERALLR